MNIKIFSDAIGVLKEVGKGVAALKDLPGKERDHYREVISETYSLLDSAVILVLNRLGDLLQIEEDDVFIRELRGLNNYDEWTGIERAVRLCSNLRAAGREMRKFESKLIDRIALTSPNDFFHLVRVILEQGEKALANFISESLSRLADMADGAEQSAAGFSEAKGAVRETRDALRKERENLIASEIEFYKYI